MGMRPLGPHGKNYGCCVFTGRRRGNTAAHRWRRHGRASIRLQRARLGGFALGGGVQPRHGRIWPRAGYGQRVSRGAAARSRCARRTRRARRDGARLRAGGLLARCSSPCSSLLPAIAVLAGTVLAWRWRRMPGIGKRWARDPRIVVAQGLAGSVTARAAAAAGAKQCFFTAALPAGNAWPARKCE